MLSLQTIHPPQISDVEDLKKVMQERENIANVRLNNVSITVLNCSIFSLKGAGRIHWI